MFPKIAGAKAWPQGPYMETNCIFFFFKTGKRWHECPPHTHTQTNKLGSSQQKYNTFDNLQNMNHLAQTEVFSHQSFVYAFSQCAPQHEGSFVVGLCVGKECDKDFKELDKSTLSFAESSVIQQKGGGGGSKNPSSNQLNTWTAVSTAQIMAHTDKLICTCTCMRIHTHTHIDMQASVTRQWCNSIDSKAKLTIQ